MPNYIFGIRQFEIKRNITPSGLLEKNSSNLKLNTLGDIKTKKKEEGQMHYFISKWDYTL